MIDSGDQEDQDYIPIYYDIKEDNDVEDMDIGDPDDDVPDPDVPNAEVCVDADNVDDAPDDQGAIGDSVENY